MNDYISREAALEAIRDWHNNVAELIDRIERLPSINPRKTGRWIHKNDDQNDWLECSECGYGSEGEVPFEEGSQFCPVCGARLEDEE